MSGQRNYRESGRYPIGLVENLVVGVKDLEEKFSSSIYLEDCLDELLGGMVHSFRKSLPNLPYIPDFDKTKSIELVRMTDRS